MSIKKYKEIQYNKIKVSNPKSTSKISFVKRDRKVLISLIIEEIKKLAISSCNIDGVVINSKNAKNAEYNENSLVHLNKKNLDILKRRRVLNRDEFDYIFNIKNDLKNDLNHARKEYVKYSLSKHARERFIQRIIPEYPHLKDENFDSIISRWANNGKKTFEYYKKTEYNDDCDTISTIKYNDIVIKVLGTLILTVYIKENN